MKVAIQLLEAVSQDHVLYIWVALCVPSSLQDSLPGAKRSRPSHVTTLKICREEIAHRVRQVSDG